MYNFCADFLQADGVDALKQRHPTPVIAVSACVLGQPVRHDGGHRRDAFVVDMLSRLVELEAICPEVAASMGLPRPTIQLREQNGAVRLVTSKAPHKDFTAAMSEVGARAAERFRGRVSGVIVQQRSPSCGLERVAVVPANGGQAQRRGTGLFTAQLLVHCPLIPIEEAGRLRDPGLREHFFERVYVLDRWYRLAPDDVEEFIEFHARHKLMLMARGGTACRHLGRLVARVTAADLLRRREAYVRALMATLARRVTRPRHVNVLQHVMGYFKRHLDAADKRELLGLLEAYRAGEVPLAAPLALLRHYTRRIPHPWLQRQWYFDPYPSELALRAAI